MGRQNRVGAAHGLTTHDLLDTSPIFNSRSSIECSYFQRSSCNILDVNSHTSSQRTTDRRRLKSTFYYTIILISIAYKRNSVVDYGTRYSQTTHKTWSGRSRKCSSYVWCSNTDRGRSQRCSTRGGYTDHWRGGHTLYICIFELRTLSDSTGTRLNGGNRAIERG